jgi:methylated-DNA-[protein]-cysteine S-methyltransferase
VESLPPLPGRTLRRDAAPAPVQRQVLEYFGGRRTHFELPLAPRGTAFQHRVWAALRAIPYGDTRSYGGLARQLGTGPRAVGRASGGNPICLIVPCHRVIGTDGSLTGYAYGPALKQLLLDHEARHGVAARGAGPLPAWRTASATSTPATAVPVSSGPL